MKKLVISFAIMGMTSMVFAQNSYPRFELSKFRDLGRIATNYEYLDEVQNGLTPDQVKYLENLASYWDVTRTAEFDGRRGQPFSVTFKTERGQIIAAYNSKGKIVSAMERFSDFAMPKTVSKAILKEYPNWKVIKNRYSVWYDLDGRTKKIFKVRIRKGNQKKWLMIDPSGNIS